MTINDPLPPAIDSTGRAARRPAEPIVCAATAPPRHPWWVLVVVAVAQLMVVLDGTIVNVALPRIQRELALSDELRSGVVTWYALVFGGTLILCGRLADRWGHRKTFLIALVGFTASSTLAGSAPTPAVLLVARAAQGLFAAALVPSGLALLSTTFMEKSRRAKAFGIHGAIAAGGAAIGLVGGGALTGAFGWRWCFLVNVPIAALVLPIGWALLPRSAPDRAVRLAVSGAVLLTGGLALLVDACVLAPSRGIGDSLVIAFGSTGLVGLILFGLQQQRVRNPLVPPHLLADRRRITALAAVAASTISGYGTFLILTFYLQDVLHLAPGVTGVGFLPLTASIVITSQLCARLVNRVAPQWLMLPGLAFGIGGMFVLSRLQLDSTYAGGVLPVLILAGCSQGLMFLPAVNSVLLVAAPREAGVAGATVSAAQQVGGALGTAMVNAVAVGVSAAAIGTGTPQADISGYSVAALVALSISVVAAGAVVWAWRGSTTSFTPAGRTAT